MKILITGISGQDGIFLSKLIDKKYKNYKIIGVSRNFSTTSFCKKIKFKGDFKTKEIKLLNVNLLNKEYVNKLLNDFRPDMLFNLSGPSSVYESIKNPQIEKDVVNIFNNITDSLIANKIFCNFFQASTSEMFGLSSKKMGLDETSKFLPNSPYASGKLKNHYKVRELREKYNWNIYSGIMFNHESEYRKDEYLFMKIINGAYNIKKNKQNNLILGSLDYSRDWSYAEEIVEGFFNLINYGSSYDYVLGSGTHTSIGQVVDIVFTYFDLDYRDHIIINPELLRNNDPIKIYSNPSKIYNELGWKTKLKIEDFVFKILKNLELP